MTWWTASARGARGGVTATFAASQASIIRALVSQVEELVGGPAGRGRQPRPGAGRAPGPGPVPGPAGPAGPRPGATRPARRPGRAARPAPARPPRRTTRCWPGCCRTPTADDTEAAGEFRRFTEQELRYGKLAAARTVLDTLPEDGGRVRAVRGGRAGLAARAERRPAGPRGPAGRSPRTSAGPAAGPRPGRSPVGVHVGLRLAHAPAGDPGTRALVADHRPGPPGTLGSMLTLHPALRDKIVAHARADHPDEACGVIAGPAGRTARSASSRC